MEAMRDRWTDDRMDDLVQRVDSGFAQVDARFVEVHEGIAALRTETHEDIAALRVDSKELRRDIAKLDRDLRAATREELNTQIHAVRSEMREGFDKVDAQFERVIATFNRRFDTLVMALISAMLAGLIGLLATHFG
jgi:lipoate-protein ligase A